MNRSDITFGELINNFIKSARNDRERTTRGNVLLNKSFEMIHSTVTLDQLKRAGGSVVPELQQAMEDTMEQLNFSKRTGYRVFKQLFAFIKTTRGIELNINKYIRREPLKSSLERRIDILKELHEGKTRSELAGCYYIDERTLRDDLNELEKGMCFLNQMIKIDTKQVNGELRYNSTVHPVFLPLNLTEVYTLTVGLKRVCQGTQYENILNDIANWVYSQISDYGRRIIDRSIKLQEMYNTFPDRYNGFINEDQQIEHDRQYRYAYLEKSIGKAVFTYNDGDEVKTLEGKIAGMSEDEMSILCLDGKLLNIPKNNIIEINNKSEA